MRQKKTLLLVSNKVYHYRVPIYQHLNDRLEAIGYKLVVLADQKESHIEEDQQFELYVQPFSYRKYRAFIRQSNPDIVMLFLHARDLVVWPLLVKLKFLRVPVIYWNHGINLMTPDDPLKRVVFGIFHQLSDALVLYSENERKYISKRHWSKLFIANNTINFNTIPDIPETKSEIRRQLNIPFDKVVLFVGRITREKRLDDLIEAAQFLNEGTGVVIVGDGLSSDQVARIDEASNIQYLGAIYDAEAVNRVFKMADVFSIPGKVGLGVNQAFYWGLPIVTERVLHSPEIVYVKDGINGYIVEKHDSRMLADRINTLLASDAEYAKFSNAARSEILNNANIDKMCDGFVNAVEYIERMKLAEQRI